MQISKAVGEDKAAAVTVGTAQVRRAGARKELHRILNLSFFIRYVMQDPKKRKALDGAREDAKMRERAEAAAAQEERERQWRVARGTATAEDLRGPIRVGPAQRDTWMTDLPEARRPNVAPQQVNVVSQSASE